MTDEMKATPDTSAAGSGDQVLRGVTDVFDRVLVGDEGVLERSDAETLRLLNAQYGIDAEPVEDPEPVEEKTEPEPVVETVVEETKPKPKPKRAPRKA